MTSPFLPGAAMVDTNQASPCAGGTLGLPKGTVHDASCAISEHHLDVRVLVGSADLASIAPQWQALYETCRWAPIHLHPGWVMAFAEWPGVEGCLGVSAWRGTELVGLLPLSRRRIGPFAIWSPMGTGLGGVLHPLTAEGDVSTMTILLRCARRSVGIRQILAEDVVSASTSGGAWLDAAHGAGWRTSRVCRNPNWTAELSASYDDFLSATKSSKSRQTLRRQIRQTHRAGLIQIERLAGHQIDDTVVDRLAGLQDRSWMKRRGAAVLGQPWYRRLLRGLALGGCLHAGIMKVDGVDAAFNLGMISHGRYHLGWLAFDLKFERIGVGRALLADTIAWCCMRGIR